MLTQNWYKGLVVVCPHCNSSSLSRFGFDRGIQRYQCKQCKKTFKATINTPVHGLHKREKLTKYLHALQKGMSVRKAATYAGISKNTSFNWRHKLLASLPTDFIVKTPKQTVVTAVVKLEYSSKGRRKPPEKCQQPTKTLITEAGGQLMLQKLHPTKPSRHILNILSLCRDKDSIVAVSCSLLPTVIRKLSEQFMVAPKNRSELLVSGIKKKIKDMFVWMGRFRGVASKYLQQYWQWYSLLNNIQGITQKNEVFFEFCCMKRSLPVFWQLKGL